MRLRQVLANERKKPYERREGRIDFDDPIWRNFFVLPRPSLSFYDQGRFWIDASSPDRRLHYELESLHAFLFCFAAALFLFVFEASRREAAGAAMTGILAFICLYGCSLLWTRARLLPLLEKVTGAGD